MSLSESEFNARVDATLAALETAIDRCGIDIDYDTVGGVMSCEFENRSKLILSRQAPLRQLWVAAKSGGFHFNWNGSDWQHDGSGEALWPFLSRLASEQAGERVTF